MSNCVLCISYIVSDSKNRRVGSNLLQARLHMYNWCEWTTTWWNYSAAYRNTDMQNHHASPILLVPTEAAKNSSIDMRMHSSLFLLPNWVQLKRQIYNHSSHKKWSKVTMQSLVSLHIFIYLLKGNFWNLKLQILQTYIFFVSDFK